MICALAVVLSFGLRSYANAAFNPDVKITGASSPAYWGTQWALTLASAFITFLEQNGYKAATTSSPQSSSPGLQLRFHLLRHFQQFIFFWKFGSRFCRIFKSERIF